MLRRASLTKRAPWLWRSRSVTLLLEQQQRQQQQARHGIFYSTTMTTTVWLPTTTPYNLARTSTIGLQNNATTTIPQWHCPNNPTTGTFRRWFSNTITKRGPPPPVDAGDVLQQIQQRTKAWLASPLGELTPEDWFGIEDDLEILLQQGTVQSVDLMLRLLHRLAQEQGVISSLTRAEWVNAELLKQVMRNWFWIFKHGSNGASKHAFMAHYNPVVMVDLMDHFCEAFHEATWSSQVAYYIVAAFNAQAKASGNQHQHRQGRLPPHGLDFAPQLLDRVVAEWKRSNRTNDDLKPAPELFQAVAYTCTAKSIPPRQRQRAAECVDSLLKQVKQELGLATEPDLQLLASSINAWALTRSAEGALKAQERLDEMWRAHLEHGAASRRTRGSSISNGEYDGDDDTMNAPGSEQQEDAVPGWIWVNALRSAINGWAWSGHKQMLKRVEALLVRATDFIESGLISKETSTRAIWNAALQACAVTATPQAAELATRIVQAFDRQETEPDRISFYWYIASLVNGGELNRGEELLFDIIKTGAVTAPGDFVAMVLHGYARSQDNDKYRRAQRIVNRVQNLSKGKFQLDASGYNALLECCATSSGRNAYFANKAVSLLNEMRETASQRTNHTAAPDLKCYTSVIKCLGNIGDGKQAESLYEELFAKYKQTGNRRMKPDTFIFNKVLIAYSNSRDGNALSDAQSFFQRALDRHRSGELAQGPDSYSFTVLVSCIVSAEGDGQIAIDRARVASKLMDQLQTLYAKEDRKDWQPTTELYNAVMKCWAKAGSPADCEATLERMLEDYINGNHMAAPDIQSFNVLLGALADSDSPYASERADAVVARIKDMRNNKILSSGPNLGTYNAVIRCHVRCGESIRAEAVLRVMEREYESSNLDSPPDETTYELVRSATENDPPLAPV